MKDLVEVQLPGDDGLLVVLRMCESRQWIPSTFLDDLLLDPCHGSVIMGTVRSRIKYSVCRGRRWGSHCQLLNCIAHRLTEIAHSPSIHPSIECSTYIRACQTEFDIVQFVNHRVLAACEYRKLDPGRGRTYPDHGEQDTDGAKNSLRWCDARDLLREIHGLYG